MNIGFVPTLLIWGAFIILCIVALYFLAKKGRKIRNQQSPKPHTTSKPEGPEDEF